MQANDNVLSESTDATICDQKKPTIDDLCTRTGALRLKQRFEEYWLARGYIARYKLVERGFVAAMRSARWEPVGTNFVNGVPTERVDGNVANAA